MKFKVSSISIPSCCTFCFGWILNSFSFYPFFTFLIIHIACIIFCNRIIFFHIKMEIKSEKYSSTEIHGGSTIARWYCSYRTKSKKKSYEKWMGLTECNGVSKICCIHIQILHITKHTMWKRFILSTRALFSQSFFSFLVLHFPCDTFKFAHQFFHSTFYMCCA